MALGCQEEDTELLTDCLHALSDRSHIAQISWLFKSVSDRILVAVLPVESYLVHLNVTCWYHRGVLRKNGMVIAIVLYASLMN